MCILCVIRVNKQNKDKHVVHSSLLMFDVSLIFILTFSLC